MSAQGNKLIAINTIIIYIRMVLVAVVNILVTRYVLKSLGVSDYGLYNVVGGIVTMMSFISIAMMSTTRRYVNVEMGKKEKGDVNKVFNVCYSLHIVFAILIFLIALTAGLWYICNCLNLNPGKLSDAVYVFFISTTVSAITIVNVPFQALMTAYERFTHMAIIDFSTTCLKMPLVILLLLYTGNHLRFYALGICLITIVSLFLYFGYCYRYFNETIKWNFCKEKRLYKEILTYNNYTSMGAFAVLGRSQGSTMIINFFFGTIVNGAYAIAMQIDTQLTNIVGNIGAASYPQMTQSYSAGDYERSFELVCKITRYSALLMFVLSFSIYCELEFILGLWLHIIPVGAVVFCQAVLLDLLMRSLVSGIDGLIQATGRLKVYQLISSTLMVLPLPIAIKGYTIGLPAVFIIYVFVIADFIRMIAMFIIVTRVAVFDFRKYFRNVYIPLLKVMVVFSIYFALYNHIDVQRDIIHVIGGFISFTSAVFISFYFGLYTKERQRILTKLRKYKI